MEIQFKHTKLQHAHKVEVTITDGDETHTGSDVALAARDAYRMAYRKARAARNWGALAEIMIYPTDPAARAIAFMRLQLRGYEHAVRRLVTDARALADERDELRDQTNRRAQWLDAQYAFAARLVHEKKQALRAARKHTAQLYRAYDALVAKQHVLLSAVARTMRYLEDAGDTESDAYQALAAVTMKSPVLGLVPRVPKARSMDATRVIARLERHIRRRERRIRELEDAQRPLEKLARKLEKELAAAREENLRLRQQLDAALDARTQAEQTLDTIQDMLKAAGIIGHVRNSVAQAIAKARQADDWKQRYQDLHEQQARRELQRDGDSAGSDSARLAAQTLRAAGYTGDDLECMVKAAIDRAAHYQRMYSKAEMERAQLFEQIKRNYGAPPATAERKAEADEPSEAPEISTAPHEAA